jgi:carboxymethylenebutenolidase
LNDWIKQDADRFASQGYVALAVDLYRGKVATSGDEAHELMRGLPEDRGLADIQAGFDALAKRDDVDPARIGVIGWCMGGGYSLDFALKEPRVKAAVVNYGHLYGDPSKGLAIHAALLGNFGGTDRGIPAADVKAFAATLKGKGKDVDFKVYDDAGHAFMNPNNKDGYKDADAKDAWSRIDAFFTRTLGAK